MIRRLWFRLLLAFVGVAVVGGVASYVVGSLVGHDAVRQGLRLGAGRGRGAATLPPEATTAFDEALSDALLWGVAAAILAGVVVAMVLSRHLARPVEAMQEGARKLAGGDFSVRVPVQGPVEISGLGDDINHLAGTLQAIEERRTRLLSELAHELRTPLTAIDGYVEGLLDGVFEPDARVFASIAEETARLRRLAGDLTTVARAEEGAFDYVWSEVDLSAVAGGVVERLRPQFEASAVSIEVSLPPNPMTVRGDRDRLDQVVTNLVGNSLGHTHEDGRVVVSVVEADDHIELRIHDDGDGIDAADLDRVFERFYRAAGTSRAGSGLGLTIVRAIVKAHGGEVAAESGGPDQGATFIVTLPKAG